MGLILALSGWCLPALGRRSGLQQLFGATADAFKVSPPSLGDLSWDEILSLYARFTCQQASRVLAEGKTAETEARLFANSYQLGLKARKRLNLKTTADAMRAAGLLYRLLKIEFQGLPGGEVKVMRCFFSSFYSSEICRVISALDDGLLSGLSGGGKLSFNKRITEGSTCCEGRLEMPGGLR